MIIVGQVETREEAEELAYIRKLSIIANRARNLANKDREE